jgi:hypothetical protein
MKNSALLLILTALFYQNPFSQSYPLFGPEIKVTIRGLTFDAMEPFISTDGNTLYFNSRNAGPTTDLFYATKVNDTLFTFVGPVGGCYDPSPEHLDAVASMDSANNFYWVTLRGLPNLYRGKYLNGTVSNYTPAYGDFNIFTPGWVVFDAAINYQGDLLYYTNGYYGPTYTECGAVPCETNLGVAQKVNDSIFQKLSNTAAIFAQVNDTNYLAYAPQITQDGLELYFTRLLKNSVNTEICVAVRSSPFDIFSAPMVLHSNLGFLPEAASPTTDKQAIYYHQRDFSSVFNIFLRYRTGTVSVEEKERNPRFSMYPNPTQSVVNLAFQNPSLAFTLTVWSTLGQEMLRTSSSSMLDFSGWRSGIYYVTLEQNGQRTTHKITKY